jgi:hypothetical protein
MNDFGRAPASEAPQQPLLLPPPGHDAPQPPPRDPTGTRGRWPLGLVVLLLFMSALGVGVWRHYAQHRQVVATAEQQSNFVPSVRVEEAT